MLVLMVQEQNFWFQNIQNQEYLYQFSTCKLQQKAQFKYIS